MPHMLGPTIGLMVGGILPNFKVTTNNKCITINVNLPPMRSLFLQLYCGFTTEYLFVAKWRHIAQIKLIHFSAGYLFIKMEFDLIDFKSTVIHIKGRDLNMAQ